MKEKIKPPNTVHYFLLISCVCTFSLLYFFGWIGLLLGPLIAIFFSIAMDSILGVRYWNNCRTVYEFLIAKKYTKNQALIEISKSAHPELSLDVHSKIITKFNNIDLLVNFLTGALPAGRSNDESALEILNNTSIQHLGGDKYKVITERKWFNK